MVFLVAEMGASHCQSMTIAKELIVKASNAGFDAVKFQTFIPEQMCNPGYKIPSGPWRGRDLLDLYRVTALPRDWHKPLYEYAYENSIIPFSSVFHPDDVDFLEMEVQPEYYKIASQEIGYQALIDRVMRTDKPVFISTGGAGEEDLKRVYENTKGVTLLHCVSEYPTVSSDMNMHKMSELYMYAANIGLSDHSMTSAAAIMAVALGASVIEKHICLDGMGEDSRFAISGEALRSFVTDVRMASDAMGSFKFEGPREFKRSLYWSRSVSKGEVITENMIDIKRPDQGADPARLRSVIGQCVLRDSEGPLSLSDITSSKVS